MVLISDCGLSHSQQNISWLLLLFSCSVVSDSLQPHELQHTRLLCPSLSPRVFAQTHVHCSDGAVQLLNPLLSPSLPALSLSQHQGLF